MLAKAWPIVPRASTIRTAYGDPAICKLDHYHAAALSDISVNEYIKRAVNAQLQQQGVDAVLLRLRDERFDDAAIPHS